jgi:hypothetical protein
MSLIIELKWHLTMDEIRRLLRDISTSDEPEREVQAVGLGMNDLPELVSSASSEILSDEASVWDRALPLVLTQPYESVGEAENGLLVFWHLVCRGPNGKSRGRSEMPLSPAGFRRFSVALALLHRIEETEVDWTTAFD